MGWDWEPIPYAVGNETIRLVITAGSVEMVEGLL